MPPTQDSPRHFVLTFSASSAQGQVARISALLERFRAYIAQLAMRADHCLRELLAQHERGDLPMDIVGVVSNHDVLGKLVEDWGLPFHHFAVSPENRPEQEARLLEFIGAQGVDFVVLARYMQVLSESVCRAMPGRIINIHHSFLPGFKGAAPYKQAFDRGVKLIGATAHFVTPDLDEGPIIEQAVERVDHGFDPQQLLSAGRAVESQVLARAMKYVLERRVFLCGRRTIVLR